MYRAAGYPYHSFLKKKVSSINADDFSKFQGPVLAVLPAFAGKTVIGAFCMCPNFTAVQIRPIPIIINNAFGLRIFEDVSFLIYANEKDGKGVPVLLKHYLKLNGKLLSFSIAEAFSGVVDGL
jgi:hypothetical protein